jgi:hypothetical protein
VFSANTLQVFYFQYFFVLKEAAVNDLSQGQLVQDGKFRTLQVTSFLKQ